MLIVTGATLPPRRVPPPWTVEESNNACFIVRDATMEEQGGRYIWQCG